MRKRRHVHENEKKRNFESRMEACKDLLLARGAGGILNMKEAAENYRALVDFPAVFGNDFPVELEIGCGKGGFICALAEKIRISTILHSKR